jgi:catechol 2,3-dioxygenase-like lactoylglutathione lyase family enzyme
VKGFADLGDLPEDDRIRIAAETAAGGLIVGVAVDDETEKVARYVAKLLARGVRVIDQQPGPVKGAVLIRIGPKES